VTVPYGWTYDMVILLIPIIAIIIQILEIKLDWKVAAFLISYLVVNLVTLYLHSFLDDFWFLWYAPFLLVWYLISIKFIDKDLDYHNQEDSDKSSAINKVPSADGQI
jgi:hypothetical protein